MTYWLSLAHGRAPLPADELLPLEAMQEQLGLTPVTAADRSSAPSQKTLPTTAAS